MVARPTPSFAACLHPKKTTRSSTFPALGKVDLLVHPDWLILSHGWLTPAAFRTAHCRSQPPPPPRYQIIPLSYSLIVLVSPSPFISLPKSKITLRIILYVRLRTQYVPYSSSLSFTSPVCARPPFNGPCSLLYR